MGVEARDMVSTLNFPCVLLCMVRWEGKTMGAELQSVLSAGDSWVTHGTPGVNHGRLAHKRSSVLLTTYMGLQRSFCREVPPSQRLLPWESVRITLRWPRRSSSSSST